MRRADRLRSLGELSAAIAHEVRNPLQGISLTLSNLRPYLQPGAERYVEVMFQEVERLDSIVGVGSKSRLACQAKVLGTENITIELLGFGSGI